MMRSYIIAAAARLPRSSPRSSCRRPRRQRRAAAPAHASALPPRGPRFPPAPRSAAAPRACAGGPAAAPARPARSQRPPRPRPAGRRRCPLRSGRTRPRARPPHPRGGAEEAVRRRGGGGPLRRALRPAPEEVHGRCAVLRGHDRRQRGAQWRRNRRRAPRARLRRQRKGPRGRWRRRPAVVWPRRSALSRAAAAGMGRHAALVRRRRGGPARGRPGGLGLRWAHRRARPPPGRCGCVAPAVLAQGLQLRLQVPHPRDEALDGSQVLFLGLAQRRRQLALLLRQPGNLAAQLELELARHSAPIRGRIRAAPRLAHAKVPDRAHQRVDLCERGIGVLATGRSAAHGRHDRGGAAAPRGGAAARLNDDDWRLNAGGSR